MKYKLYQELMAENDILSHVFMNCAAEHLRKIADGNKGLSEEDIKLREIDIQLKIAGIDCDPRLFFDELYSQYRAQVRKDALKVVKEMTSEKLRDISNSIDILAQVTSDLAQDIRWEDTNIFEK